MLMDSRPESDSEEESDEEDEEEDAPVVASRIVVFATRRNIELLCNSNTWFIDGTFKSSPSLFAQLFAILGVRRRNAVDGEDVPVPLVYAFLSGKSQVQYEAVLRAVRDAVEAYRINDCVPQAILMDFETAIINATKEVFPQASIRCCFFHLGQAVYRQVQLKGLQQAYTDENDRSLKISTHMLLALAYVSVDEVRRVFTMLQRDCPDQLEPIVKYFKQIYVGTNRREARYPPTIWNQHEAAVNNTHKTNTPL